MVFFNRHCNSKNRVVLRNVAVCLTGFRDCPSLNENERHFSCTCGVMNDLLREVFGLPDANQFFDVSVRLVVAALLGGLLGLERQWEGKAAGLRTHMLVALGSALFAIAPRSAGMTIADLSRVFQGVAAGVGFLGAGTIIKISDQQEIKGLTTAAGIWLTAAIGLAVGSGVLWLPLVAAFVGLIIVFLLRYVENWLGIR
jgi:putative Mg2+ transporter-C (MgtC) family protein